jgi:STE24 endopeptidase
MPFVFLLVFALISFQGRWPEPPEWLDTGAALVAPWALAAIFWFLAAGLARRFCRQVARYPSDQGVLWRQFQRLKRRHLILLTACYLGVLFGLGSGYAAQVGAREFGLEGLGELAQFAPFVLALLCCWAQFYDAERAFYERLHDYDRFISRWSYLSFQVRHNLLLVVPPVVLTLALRGFFVAFPGLEQYDVALAAAGVVLLAGSVASVPLILRVFLGLRSMPTGPLRERLEAAARRLGLGFNDILLWDTRRAVANAMVSGVLPWVRYIVLTDLLIEKLTPEEVEAVFGHEVGHIKHHHMLLYILFFVGSVAVLTGLWKFCEGAVQDVAAVPTATAGFVAGPWGDAAEVAAGPALLAVVSVYVFVVFGYLSRRCERQADLFGCRAVSAEAFIGALEKVADLNGIPRHHRNLLASWQHPSIAQRVEFIERLRDEPALESGFQRSLWLLKVGLMTSLAVGLVLVMGLVAWKLGPEHLWDLFRVR